MKWMLVGAIVACNACGDLLNTKGMRRFGEVHDLHPSAVRRMIARLSHNRLVVGGILAMAIAFFCLMALLSIARLSFAIPATAGSYVLETLLAEYVLHEKVGVARWAGALLVTCGVALLAL